MKKKKLKGHLKAALIIVGVGLFPFLYGVYGVIKNMGTQSWPHTRGFVLESKLNEYISESSQGGRVNKSAQIIYSYVVNGKEYRSSNISYSMFSHAYVVRKYPIGAKVTVYYDSDYPEDSVLIRGVFPLNYVGSIGIGIVVILIGLIPLLYEFYNTIRFGSSIFQH